MKNRHRIACFLFLLILPPMAAADLNHARDLEKAGKNNEAFKYYISWLNENTGSPEFAEILTHTLETADSIKTEIKLLTDHLYSVADPSERQMLLKHLALLEEYSGAISDAQMHYELASFIDPKNRDYNAFLSSALILFELGDIERAEAQAKTLIRLSPDPAVSFKGKLLLLRTFVFNERMEEANLLLNELAETVDTCCSTPLSYFTLYDLARRVENSVIMERAKTVLNDLFPDSVETALLSGRGGVEMYPSPGLFFTQQDIRFQFAQGNSDKGNDSSEETVPPALVGIQTGSFTVKENAEYMVVDLQNAGFSPVLEETEIRSKLYYKVIISDIPFDESQNVMIRLKEKGFEGFMVFP